MRRLIAALAMSAVVALGLSTTAQATGQPKTTICHPVASATGGNTHAGYSIITTANPSSHIDEETGAPKHEHDGRVDFVVDEAHPCPPSQPSPSPSPSPSPDPSPSPEPSESPTPEPPAKRQPSSGPAQPRTDRGLAITGVGEVAAWAVFAMMVLMLVGSAVLVWLHRTEE